MRDKLLGGVPRPIATGIRLLGLLEDGVVGRVGREGVAVGTLVGLALPLRGMRLGVTTTEGILGCGEPNTLAIGEAFHLGRASMGIRPPVPVGLWLGRPTELLLDLGVKIGTCKRLVLEDEEVVEDTERLRPVGPAMLSLLAEGGGGREDTRFPDRIDDALDDAAPVGDTAPCVKVAEVVVVELLPADRGRLPSVMILSPFT
jgi:hypothetical protein